MVNSTTVLVALGIDLAIGVGAFLIFSILRIIKPTTKYYDPRTWGAPLPPPLPRTLLTFIVPMLRLDEAAVIASVGLDVAMLLRIIRFCRTRTALAAAVGGRHVAEAGVWTVTAAPAPDSLLWKHLGLRSWERATRRGIVIAVLVVVALFYSIPVAFVQGLLQLDRLQNVPVIGTLVRLPVVHSLLLGVLPGLALRLFVLLLPVLLYALNRRAGAVGAEELDGYVATHFFFMQLVVVFFGSFIVGSLLNQVATWLQQPEQALTILGTSVPQTANFFILYIIFSAFIGRSWGLLRPWGLLMTSIRVMSAQKKGKRAVRRAVVIGTYRMFGPVLPEQSIVLLLGLVFSVIAPLVLLAALVFFMMSLLVDTYNWVWVFRRPYDGAGKLWKQMFQHVIVSLYIFQLVMVALLIVKRFVWVALLAPLILATMLVHHIGLQVIQWMKKDSWKR
eukprot:gene2150-2468_t